MTQHKPEMLQSLKIFISEQVYFLFRCRGGPEISHCQSLTSCSSRPEGFIAVGMMQVEDSVSVTIPLPHQKALLHELK